MIKKFEDFLNESDEIRKRLEDRIKRSFDQLRIQHPHHIESKPETTPLLPEPTPVLPETTPVLPEPIKPTKPRELKIKPKKLSSQDPRLRDAFVALKNMGFLEKEVKEFISRIEELYPETTTGDIIKAGLKEFRG